MALFSIVANLINRRQLAVGLCFGIQSARMLENENKHEQIISVLLWKHWIALTSQTTVRTMGSVTDLTFWFD